MRTLRFAIPIAMLLGLPQPAAAGQAPTSPEDAAPAPPQIAVTVTVIGTTPLPGVGVTLDRLPAPVQTVDSKDIDASGALDLSAFLNARLAGVHVNEVQGNPFQPDVNYRGYTASPLLGTPQGVSVYMDGVRLNQPFGDVVSWDLIPASAIQTMALMPGSNPVFGLNTLGGALAIETKNGLTNPGTSVEVYGGRAARRAVEFEHGGSRADGLNWFLTGNLFAEDGWRDASPSDVRQFFGRVGWTKKTSDVAITLLQADNSLTGNGLQDQQLLANDRASVYTTPDNTKNRATGLTVSLKKELQPALTLSANAYYRHLNVKTINGDINDESIEESVYQPGAAEIAALRATGYTDVPTSGANAQNTPFPFWRCIGNVLLQDEPGEKCNGLNNRSASTQNNGGFAGQITRVSGPNGEKNQLTVGGAFDRSSVDFSQSSELGYINPDHSITGLGVFADGVNAGDIDGEPFDLAVDMTSHVRTGSVYVTDTLALTPRASLTLSGRYNHTTVENHDLRNPGGGTGSLDGDHSFGRFNPSAGITTTLTKSLTAYASYGEGSRAPTSIELGCADPESPCKLPNAMAGDPPLEQVVTRTVEAGLRGHGAGFSWTAGWFFAKNTNDILFVTSEQTGFGYFKNFGETRRQGLELNAHRRFGRVTAGASYTLLDATFQSEEEVTGEGNSENDEGPGLEGAIEIEPGNRIPLIPRHVFKAYADVQLTPALSIDVNVIASSGVIARGNENNAHEPDDLYYLGPGATDPYGIVNLGVRYQLHPRLQLFAQVNNLFNTDYTTAAQLGSTGFLPNGNFIARKFPAVDGEFPGQGVTFYAPGAPTFAWGGVRVKF
jgi:outer membrane receptor protein involved in Fe transport